MGYRLSLCPKFFKNDVIKKMLLQLKFVPALRRNHKLGMRYAAFYASHR